MPPLATILEDLRSALIFFTRLPIPHGPEDGRPFGPRLWAAPVAGLVVGLLAAAVFWIADRCNLPVGVAAALALAAAMAATGCLHEDGLADTADGFGGGRTREHKLEIMRDSRIGTFGAAALMVSILIKWSAVVALAAPQAVLPALIAAHVASRAVLPAFMVHTPPARPDGLSAAVGLIGNRVSAVALVLGLVALLQLGIGTAIIAVILAAAVTLALRALALRQIGGQTGDTIGALQQSLETTILIITSAALTP